MTGPEPDAGALTVRAPRQQRSREAWNRVLDAGVAILEDGGVDAFTIAEVCRRAAVAPPAIYARTTSKEALFLAVYEHGIARLRSDEPLAGAVTGGPADPAALVRDVVAGAVRLMLRHRRFLGAVVLISASHAEVRRRGSAYSRDLGQQFADALTPVRGHMTHPDPGSAIDACFDLIFAAAIIRVAYGAGFASRREVGDDTFVGELCEVAVGYLLRAPGR